MSPHTILLYQGDCKQDKLRHDDCKGNFCRLSRIDEALIKASYLDYFVLQQPQACKARPEGVFAARDRIMPPLLETNIALPFIVGLVTVTPCHLSEAGNQLMGKKTQKPNRNLVVFKCP